MKTYLYIFLLIAVSSCKQENKQTTSGAFLSDTTRASVIPQLGKMPEGNPYCWWIEQQDNEKNVVLFSISSDQGKTFGNPLRIPVTEGCNDGHGQGMPRLVFKKDGTMVIVYHVKEGTESNPYAGRVFYSQSFDHGTSWETPRTLHQDTLKDNSHGFPALALLPNGEVGAIWLDGRNKLPYSEMFFSHTDGKKGFVEEKKIGGPTCQCCKLDLYTDKDQQVHVLYRGILEDNIRDIMHLSSLDSGKTFSSPQRISEDGWKIKGCPHAGPSMTSHQDSLHYVWFTMGGGEGIFYCRSDKKAAGFSKREILASGISKYPQIASVNDHVLAIAWQEYDTLSIPGSSYNRIKLLLTKKEKPSSGYATDQGLTTTHPTLLPISETALLIAYEQQLYKKPVIAFKRIEVE